MLNTSNRLTSRPGSQRGSFLIEALIGILIFSLGILALVGMQAAAISAQSDARYRTEASNLAQQMVNNIWLNVSRTNAAALQTSLDNFEHQPAGGACNFSGTVSGNPLVSDWIDSVTAAGSGLPGATAAMQQITVNTDAGGFNRVAITVCWLPPRAATPNRHTVVTYVN
jgi:type IV pilus assembly protein PilV